MCVFCDVEAKSAGSKSHLVKLHTLAPVRPSPQARKQAHSPRDCLPSPAALVRVHAFSLGRPLAASRPPASVCRQSVLTSNGNSFYFPPINEQCYPSWYLCPLPLIGHDVQELFLLLRKDDSSPLWPPLLFGDLGPAVPPPSPFLTLPHGPGSRVSVLG